MGEADCRGPRERHSPGPIWLSTGRAPSQKVYEFFISKWCDMVHIKMTATCGIQKFR